MGGKLQRLSLSRLRIIPKGAMLPIQLVSVFFAFGGLVAAQSASPSLTHSSIPAVGLLTLLNPMDSNMKYRLLQEHVRVSQHPIKPIARTSCKFQVMASASVCPLKADSKLQGFMKSKSPKIGTAAMHQAITLIA